MDYWFVDIPKTAGTSIRSVLHISGHGHSWAPKRIEEIGRDAWDALFTFTFVRNPWDRIVSQYHFQAQKKPHALYRHLFGAVPEDEPPIGFKTWVQLVYGEIVPNLSEPFWAYRPQTDWFMDGDEQLVDFVGRFERLQMDFMYVCQVIGRTTYDLPRHKASMHKPFKYYYDSATADVVAEYFARDIELFGYKAPV